MPLWIYWALFFAVVGLSLLAAAWLDAREGARELGRTPSAKPSVPFERPGARSVEAIEAPGAVDPFAMTLEIDRSQALDGTASAPSVPTKREDDGPSRE